MDVRQSRLTAIQVIHHEEPRSIDSDSAHGAESCTGHRWIWGHRCEYYGIDPFTVIFGGTLAFFIVFVLLLGLFSKRSAIDILDWKPTRSPEVEAQNDIDDVQQMIDAQNEIRRRRGLPERDEEEIAASVERHREELREQARRYRSEDG